MKTIDDLEVSGRRVLVRADLNVLPDGTRITDDLTMPARVGHSPQSLALPPGPGGSVASRRRAGRREHRSRADA
jgi:hypothetical protein